MLYITDDPAWIDAITEADAEAKAEAEYEAARAAYHATKAPAKQRFYVTYGCGTRLGRRLLPPWRTGFLPRGQGRLHR